MSTFRSRDELILAINTQLVSDLTEAVRPVLMVNADNLPAQRALVHVLRVIADELKPALAIPRTAANEGMLDRIEANIEGQARMKEKGNG